ncbi:AAA family ATPase [Shewanella sp. NR704-98]|uniref:AAA family ATPase n=2 Tax=Shewanella nanhaiensis TaxID=2864872 RepID=A0ABS7E9F9_9GAMM|nr:AAA family ATPase [Shewanella nanhaiensis]
MSLQEYFLDVFESRGGNDGEWVGEYRNYNQLSAKEKASDDQAIKELWTKGTTWVASIKNGIMSGDDYRKSEPDLIEFTRMLIEGTSAELYQQSIELLNRLLNEGKISRRYWATTNRVFASLHPTELSTTVAEDALRKVYQYLDARFYLRLKNPSSINWYGLNQELLETIQPLLKDVMDTDAINVTLWYIYESLSKTSSVDNFEVREPASKYGKKVMKSPLNQILYGPPGTGKTYHTIEAAVKAAEPDEYAGLGIEPKLGANEDQRLLLTEMYRTLSDAGRIRFVTFHQSYGYEEFVEGVSAKTENGHISYYEKDGVFKSIVEEAKKRQETRTTDEKHDFDTLWNRFIEKLSTSEEGVKVDTIRTFFMVTDVDNNTVRFEKDKGNSTHSLSVKTLKAIFNGEREIKGGLNPYYSALIKHLKQLAQAHSEVKTERRNYVLVIDEINRGNISKIFGELITLIEPSKRKGANEELEVILPYSGDTFFVPDNLHIIGTMNTADRSLAMMDTALRRRFDFKEMMPNPDVFEGREVKGINISQLLRALNKRIEVLYDREHTLGHAFLFPVFNEDDENKAFVELQAAFKNKIIPLLEEYFYEDWNKIRLVLGDSLKDDKKLQFLEVQKDSYLDLFGDNHGLELYEEAKITYQVKPFESTDSVWSRAEAYIGIYSPKAMMSETSEG